MKPTSPTRMASPDFHHHFTWEFIWRASHGKRARHLDVSYNFLSLWIKIMNEQCIDAKISGPPGRATTLCCVYMDDFYPAPPPGEISPKRASPLSMYMQKGFVRGMTKVVESHQRGIALLRGLAHLHINTP